MGRIKRPGALRLVEGARPDKVNAEAPKPRVSRPVAPRDMSPDARKVWHHVLREFGDTGVLRGIHRDLLRAYCEATARYHEAAVQLASSGPLVKGRGGELIANPLHRIARDNARLARDLAREMGMTPSSAEGIHVPSDGTPNEDDAASWEASYGAGRRA